ncbi:type II toxin-antitoxin system antitoxin SocA domain-containing protein [Capnocytophaga canis]|uniref:type II toxin-antitoxin system antitoxin SocA domain-containing protein n=1 Tax=Capnocytophaga canis TaxID=1848903 RepID=UPI001562C68A|nr:type II toxin-antitoxin system antitoxin SocA domain-containing protein [Capnocytophaga canis]
MSEKADNLQNKLDTFSYMIGRFVDWEKEIRKEKEEKETSSEEILEGFSQTRLMKLLYFTCLASFEDKEDIGLFSIFNNFEAYPKGPVEVDVYSNRSELTNFKYNGFYLEKLSDDEAVKVFIDEAVKISIDRAINFLKQKKDSFNMLDTDFLVELSHKLHLWNMAYFSDSNQLDIENKEYLSLERKQFINLVEAIN